MLLYSTAVSSVLADVGMRLKAPGMAAMELRELRYLEPANPRCGDAKRASASYCGCMVELFPVFNSLRRGWWA
jgi:hypothetical protein